MIENMSKRAETREKVMNLAVTMADQSVHLEESIEDLRFVRDNIMRGDLTASIIRLDSAGRRIQFSPNQKVYALELKNELAHIQQHEAEETAKENARLAAEPDYSVPSLSRLINQLPKAVGVEGLEVKALDLIPRIVDAAADVLRKSKGHEEQNEELQREVNGLRKSLGWETKYVPREKPKTLEGYSDAPTPGFGGKTFRP